MKIFTCLILAALLLGACTGEGDTRITNAKGGIVNVTGAGPIIVNTDSPCGGNVNSSAGADLQGDEADGNDSTSTSANNPDCSPPPPVVVTPVVTP